MNERFYIEPKIDREAAISVCKSILLVSLLNYRRENKNLFPSNSYIFRPGVMTILYKVHLLKMVSKEKLP
jgi:hypothetical protein